MTPASQLESQVCSVHEFTHMFATTRLSFRKQLENFSTASHNIMSLRPDDSQRRSRSKSPGRRERSRSRADDERPRERSRSRQAYDHAPSPPRGNYLDPENDGGEVYRKYEETIRTTREAPQYAVGSEYSTYPDSGVSAEQSRRSRGRNNDDDLAYGSIGGRNIANEDKYKKENYDPRSNDKSAYGYGETQFAVRDDRHGHDQGLSMNLSGGFNVGQTPLPRQGHAQQYGAPPYGPPPFQDPRGSGTSFVEQPKYNHYQPSDNYGARPAAHYTQSYESDINSHSLRPATSLAQTVTVEPGRRQSASLGLAPSMATLSVYGRESHHSLSSAPPSPLQEAYQGTYQSISPMPSPLMLATASSSSVGILEPLSPRTSSSRHARFHDPADDAQLLANALSASRKYPDLGPLIQILPSLTHAQILDLRSEYKKLVKTGSGHDIKGVNVAKHIKLRLKEEHPNFLKACYACALGQWESEAYWANFWYHGEKSNRELLIESLMGRTNSEIREIKDGFKDKKYGDSLTKCMKTELKEDKFKKAVLMVLEERRMEESRSGRVDRDLVDEDVHTLHKAVKSEKGGESAIINVVVLGSDSHLRECLRVYEKTHHANFTREVLKKSGNLVVSHLMPSNCFIILIRCRVSY